jgi:hypothetical protein
LERETDLSLYLRGVYYCERSWLKVTAFDFLISSCSKKSFSGDLFLVFGTGFVTLLGTGLGGRVGLVLKLVDRIYLADL